MNVLITSLTLFEGTSTFDMRYQVNKGYSILGTKWDQSSKLSTRKVTYVFMHVGDLLFVPQYLLVIIYVLIRNSHRNCSKVRQTLSHTKLTQAKFESILSLSDIGQRNIILSWKTPYFYNSLLTIFQLTFIGQT